MMEEEDKIMDLTVTLNVNGEFLRVEEQLLTRIQDMSILTITPREMTPKSCLFP